MTRYWYDADKGQAIPVESDDERLEREEREERERRELAWKREEEERERKRVGAYL